MNYCLPEQISPEIFLRDYWQKKPLLIKNGLPQIVGKFEPADIIELAQNEEATARLIKQFSSEKWKLTTSPLDENDFANLPEHWSVLVQNMEQWSVELGEMWQAFGFIPQWQRDDIMVSYAPKGGSVGKHYDEYDVFLVQGYGHRRWQLGKWCDPSTEFKPNQPIRIFDDMGELVFDEVLAPGDILYVPSRLSHYGVAQDDCLTFSFGLRYPNCTDLVENISRILCQPHPELEANSFNIPLRLSPDVQPTGLLAPASITNIKQQLINQLSQPEFEPLFQHALASTVTARRYEMLVGDDMAEPDQVLEWLEDGACLRQDNNCKLAYTSNPLRIYANGEWLDEIGEFEAQILCTLADGRTLGINELERALKQNQELLLDSICNWLDDGWVILD